MGEDRDTSAARVGQNQALYREVNERVKELNEAFDALTPVPQLEGVGSYFGRLSASAAGGAALAREDSAGAGEQQREHSAHDCPVDPDRL